MKVLIFSDLHIFAHKRNIDRINDCLDALEWVFQTAKNKKIKHILFLGDLFHDRQKIDVLAYQKTFEIFDKWHKANDFRTYLLIGNHDMYYADRWDINSIAPLFIIENVDVISSPSTIPIGEFELDFLPYTHNPIEDLINLSGGKKRRFLGAHISVDGAKLNSYGTESDVCVEHDGNMVKVDKNVFSNWDHVFLGHYHCPQLLSDSVEYIGSPLELSFGEVGQNKRICIFDLATGDKEYISNTFSPKHLVVNPYDIEESTLEGNFVRIVADELSSTDVADIQKQLKKNTNIKSVEVKFSIKKIDDENIVAGATAILLKEDEMIEKYIEEQDKDTIEDLDKKLLLEIGKSICEEATASQNGI